MSEHAVHEEAVGELTIKIYPDECSHDPRGDDNMGTMVCWHRRYRLGDKMPKESPSEYFSGICGADLHPEHEWRTDGEPKLEKCCLVLPLYLYDHSGLTMNTTGFSCPWDSGQVGYIYVTFEDIRKEYGVKRVTDKVKDQTGKMVRAIDMARRVLEAEVKIYDYYLKGEVYCYVVEDENGENLDSCGGYLGDKPYPGDSREEKDRSSWNYMLSEARSRAEWHLKERAKKKAERTKTLIKHCVPLEKRVSAEKGA